MPPVRPQAKRPQAVALRLGSSAGVPVSPSRRVESAPEPVRLPGAPAGDRLPVTRAVMSWWPRWRDADERGREHLRRGVLDRRTVAALERLEANLAACGKPEGWTRWSQGSACTLRPGLLERLLAGLDLQPNAVPDLLRACRVHGHNERALERALQDWTKAPPAPPAPTPKERSEMTLAQRVEEACRTAGLDWRKQMPDTSTRKGWAQAWGTTEQSIYQAVRIMRQKAGVLTCDQHGSNGHAALVAPVGDATSPAERIDHAQRLASALQERDAAKAEAARANGRVSAVEAMLASARAEIAALQEQVRTLKEQQPQPVEPGGRLRDAAEAARLLGVPEAELMEAGRRVLAAALGALDISRHSGSETSELGAAERGA